MVAQKVLSCVERPHSTPASMSALEANDVSSGRACATLPSPPRRFELIELLRMAASTGGDGRQAIIHPCPTHAELAVLVGSQREPVTRELNRLAALKIVSQAGRTLRILDLPALADEIERIGGEV